MSLGPRHGTVYFPGPHSKAITGLVTIDGVWVHTEPDDPKDNAHSHPVDRILFISWTERMREDNDQTPS